MIQYISIWANWTYQLLGYHFVLIWTKTVLTTATDFDDKVYFYLSKLDVPAARVHFDGLTSEKYLAQTGLILLPPPKS